MRGESRKWVWRCAEDSTPAASRSDLPSWRLAARVTRPPAPALSCISASSAAKPAGASVSLSRTVASVPAIGGFVRDDMQDQPGDERLGFLVPMGVAGLSGRVVDQRIGQGVGIFREIEAGGIVPVEWVVAGRGPARDAERIEAPDRPLGGTGAGGDAGVLALGVDADHRADRAAANGDDRADALARAGWEPSSADAPRRHSGAACPTSPSGRSGDPRFPPASARRHGRQSGRNPAARFAGWRRSG